MRTFQKAFGQMVCAVGLLLLLMTACNQPTQNPPGFSDQDLSALHLIAEQDSAIVMSRNWDVLAAEYTADAVRMPPNQPAVKGREAIRKWLEQMPPVTNFSFQLVDLQGGGEFAFMHGRWSITAAPLGADTVRDSGKILVVLRKQKDGSWLRVADAWNSDISPAK